jgi:hypothetical protein
MKPVGLSGTKEGIPEENNELGTNSKDKNIRIIG